MPEREQFLSLREDAREKVEAWREEYCSKSPVDAPDILIPVRGLDLPPKTDPTLELEFWNRRKGRYGTQEVHI
jgi:hypothetical protein